MKVQASSPQRLQPLATQRPLPEGPSNSDAFEPSSTRFHGNPARPASGQTPMTTGNGYGFATFSKDSGAITRFYAHPYRFAAQKPGDPFADGPQSPNLVKSLAWRSQAPGEPVYRQESQVIEVPDGEGRQRFYMPFGLKRATLVTSAEGQAHPRLEVHWAAKVASDTTQTLSGRQVRLVGFKAGGDRVALVPLDDRRSAWALTTLGPQEDPARAVAEVVAWQGSASPAQLAAREVDRLDSWRSPAPPKLEGEELKLWRQSETVLRMAQVQEDTAHAKGLILASLPPGEWFIPWVRDMSYATVALTRMGHQQEARQALEAYLNARPMGSNKPLTHGEDYQISTVRYNGDGSEAADKSGEPDPNLEFDSWGLALWAAGEYVGKFEDTAWLKSPTYRGSVYENLRDFVARPLMDNLNPYQGGLITAADTSIWEQNDLPRMHYAASTLTAIRGLRSFAEMARRVGDQATASQVQDRLGQLQTGFEKAFVREGRVHGVLEDSPKNDVDAAVLEAINFDVESSPAVIQQTLDSLEALHMPSGGYRRVTGDTSYEKHEFLWSDFALARALIKTGHPEKAAPLIQRTVERSARDHHLVPEMYVSMPDSQFPGQVGDPTGAIPMVGYGAGVYALTLMDREGIRS